MMFTGPGANPNQDATAPYPNHSATGPGPGNGFTLTTEQPVPAQAPGTKAFGPGSTYFPGTPKFAEN
jgi:hypothetical protein